jgi:hypothetical protein
MCADQIANEQDYHHQINGVSNVYFGPLKLGRLVERHLRIEDAYG